MDIDATLRSLQATALAVSIRDSLLYFPLLEAVHVLGLSLVVGTVVVIDLRLLGLASVDRPFRLMSSEILKWTWGAFALTVLAGALMFTTNAEVYFHNVYFRTKLTLLALAGLNVLVFQLTANRTVDRWDRSRVAPPIGRAVAVITLAIWIAAVFAGRMIGFTSTRQTTPPPATEDINFEELLGLPGSSTPDSTAPVPKK
jgi:hypothetical protein